MSLITLILMLAVGAVIIYAVKLLFANQWQQLIILAVVLLVVLWILGGIGINLPPLGLR